MKMASLFVIIGTDIVNTKAFLVYHQKVDSKNESS